VKFFSDRLSLMSLSYLQNHGVKTPETPQSFQASFIFRLRGTDAQKVGEGLCGANRKADRIRLYPGRRVSAARTRRGLPADGRSR
jgi:hypothetical protein